MKLLKIFLLSILGFMTLIASLIVALYFNLGFVINTDRLDYALKKYDVFKSYNWKKGEISWKNRGLTSKELSVVFGDFCFLYDKEGTIAEGCFEVIELKALVSLTPPFLTYLSNLHLESSKLKVLHRPSPEKEENAPQEIDLQKYYSYLWSEYVPGLDVHFKKLDIDIGEKKHFVFPLKIVKNNKGMSVTSNQYEVLATQKGIQLLSNEDIFIPVQKEKIKVSGSIVNLTMGKNIDVKFFTLIEFAKLSITTKIPSVFWTDKISPLISNIISHLKIDLFIPELSKNIEKRVRPPYNKLPAPLHGMDGDVAFRFDFSAKSELVSTGKGELKVDLRGNNQFLNLSIFPSVDISAVDFSYHNLSVEVLFNKVFLELPRLSKKSLPPQFTPDARFKSAKEEQSEKKSQDSFKINLDILANEEKSLHLKTDLLDEDIRLNFHFLVEENELQKGHVRLLPLKTTILKRPIRVENLLVKFPKGKLPELVSEIWFDLPEYKVKLVMEGPLSSPRYLFTSIPPLPQSDIYSVLLFGRPLRDMGGDDTMAAQQTRQLLGQGLISLSVLYILSGTPIEYIGYDAQSREATAQVGLGEKSSLRVSSGESGRKSTGIRRSLGRGWYLDTSVQTPNNTNSDKGNKDYGVFLERIISY